jgi:plastocyanin
MTRLPRVALACLALALGGASIAACGSDDNSSADKSAPADTQTTETTAPTQTTSGDDSSASKQVIVTMQGNQNMPAEVSVKVGQTIKWDNKDGYDHNVTSSDGASEKIDSGNFTKSFEYAPKKAGSIPYVCTIHSGQGGTITVK